MRFQKPFFAYRSFWKELDTVKRFYDAGIREFCVFPSNTTNTLGQPYGQYPPNWLYFDAYEFEHVDRQINDILSAAPEAKLLCMVDLNSPNWLVRQLMYSLCDSTLGVTDALTTERWREETLKYMRALLTHIETAFPGRVKAYILAGGMTDEWMDNSKGREIAAKREAFLEWCGKNNYPVPDSIPDIARRYRSDAPLGLRDPQKDADSIHYWKFISECIADGMSMFAREARKIIPETTALGAFYGYILQLGFERLVQCGHLAYEKAFSSPDLDFFISPGIYNDRAMGGGGGFMSPNGTIHRFGKNYFHEIDHGTSTANYRLTRHVELKWMERWPDEKADIAGNRREFCRSLFHGASLWWFDMWGKYYESQKLVDEIGEYKRIGDELGDVSREPEAEIAVIVDPESTLYINDAASGLQHLPAKELFTPLLSLCNRLGTPYKVYSLRDIPHLADFGKIRFAILPGLFEVTPEKEELLRKFVLKDSRTVLWTYGAALNDGIRKTPENMRELTGIPFGTAEAKRVAMNGWTCLFAPSTPALSVHLLRKYAQDAGVHFFTDMECPVWAAEDLLMIHTTESGKRTIRLRRPAKLRTLLGNPVPERECTEFEYEFSGPETILVQLGKPSEFEDDFR